jgi:hypothetical protein
MRSRVAIGPLAGPGKSRCRNCHRARLAQSWEWQFHGKVLKLVRSPVVAGMSKAFKAAGINAPGWRLRVTLLSSPF